MISHEETVRYLEAVHENTVHHTLGMRFESYDPEGVIVALDVDQRLYQPLGKVHGGIYVLMAESAASTAAALSVDLNHFTVAGMEINANHLRSVREGILRAKATIIHAGRTIRVYSIEVRDGQERLVSISRCTVAIRPRRVESSD